MKTKFLITYLMLSILFASLISYADARGFSPFHFRLADEIMYDDLWFYVDGSKLNFKVDKGETATFPLVITSKHSVGTVVDFHATIGNDQMGEIRFPPGVNIQLEPNQMILNGQNQTLNVTVHVSEKAPSSKYNVNLVGVWQEEGNIPDFMGTGFSLHVGRDFGNDAIPVNFFLPPLKFAKEGIPPEEIPCRNAFILILKYDGSPACVTESTRQKLIERGWVKNECARLFDSSMDKYSNHAKEQREKGVVWTPPTLKGLVLKSDYFEEWRNYGCIETINDWKHLSENTRSLNELDLNKLK